MLIGNKVDLPPDKIRVSTDEGMEKAIKYEIPFCETSAKDNINIDKAFMIIARDMKLKIEKDKQKSRKTIQLGVDKPKKRKQDEGCCGKWWKQEIYKLEI